MNPGLPSTSAPPKKFSSFKIFTVFTNKMLCSTLGLYVANIVVIDVYNYRTYRHNSTTKTKVFASVRNSHRSSQLAAHKQNSVFHLRSIRCKHSSYRFYNYRHCSTMKTKVFASVRNSHRSSQLTAVKHFFLPKCRFAISHEPNK